MRCDAVHVHDVHDARTCMRACCVINAHDACHVMPYAHVARARREDGTSSSLSAEEIRQEEIKQSVGSGGSTYVGGRCHVWHHECGMHQQCAWMCACETSVCMDVYRCDGDVMPMFSCEQVNVLVLLTTRRRVRHPTMSMTDAPKQLQLARKMMIRMRMLLMTSCNGV